MCSLQNDAVLLQRMTGITLAHSQKLLLRFLRRAKNDAREKDCEAVLQLADNDLCFMSELSFKVGDKVKAHYGAEGNCVG